MNGPQRKDTVKDFQKNCPRGLWISPHKLYNALEGFFCLVQISRKKSAPLKIRKVLQIFSISSLLFFDKMPFLIDIPVFSVQP